VRVIISENSNSNTYFYEAFGYVGIIGNIVFSVLDTASDREPKVRSHVAVVLELLLQARLVDPIYFYPIAEVVLEKLGDPDIDVKYTFVRKEIPTCTTILCIPIICNLSLTYKHGTKILNTFTF
jgi:PI-3-kinase-related kinase SMG-1